MKQPVLCVEIYGGNHNYEISNLFRVECRIDCSESPTLANTQQINLVQLASLSDYIHSVIDVAVDIVVKGKIAVTGTWIAPVDYVDVLPMLQELIRKLLSGWRSIMYCRFTKA